MMIGKSLSKSVLMRVFTSFLKQFQIHFNGAVETIKHAIPLKKIQNDLMKVSDLEYDISKKSKIINQPGEGIFSIIASTVPFLIGLLTKGS